MTPASFEDVCRVLKNHFKGKTCIATVNRLWRKNGWVTDKSALPELEESSLHVTRELWDIERLWANLRPEQTTDIEPLSTESEIVAIRWGGRDYVIDGRKRINHWKRGTEVGPHPMLVVTPQKG